MEEVNNKTPLLCLLSMGSDPTSQIENLASSRAQEYRQLSMGQGQEEAARTMLVEAMRYGQWLMLQNCHLSLNFSEEIIQSLEENSEYVLSLEMKDSNGETTIVESILQATAAIGPFVG